jgi:predicted permease
VRSPDVSAGKPWWQPLLSLVNFILLGYCLRTFFAWDSRWTTKFRRFTFNILLPIYVFRNMWVSRIERSLASIAQVGLFVHIIQAIFWALLYRNVRDVQMRGWLLMISQGCLTSFFYSNLASHPSFGQEAVAICLLFDIAGNTPCAQGLLWGIAAYYAPEVGATSPSTDFRSAFSSPLMPSSVVVTRQVDMESCWQNLESVPGYSKKSAAASIEPFESDSLLGRSPLESQRSSRKSWLDIVKAVIIQPVLPAFVLGLVLSINDIGCPGSIDYGMEIIGLFFKPSLYFLIGLYSEFITDRFQLKIVLTALGLRYLFAGFMALMIWLWLPFGSLERTTMALSFLSPVSTMTMYLAAEYDYPKQFISMSAALTTMSVFLSFMIQEAVMRSY